jgi:uncharacterized protein YecT (DUF1311 family)
MRRILSVFAMGLMFFFSQTALAEGECDEHQAGYDRTFCLAKLLIESDNELNTVYQDLRKLIKEDSKKQLTFVQQEWMQYRDITCQSRPGAITTGCAYNLNRERTNYLRDRLRECKTGACRNDKIEQKNW